jgi:hypothetical protein
LVRGKLPAKATASSEQKTGRNQPSALNSNVRILAVAMRYGQILAP